MKRLWNHGKRISIGLLLCVMLVVVAACGQTETVDETTMVLQAEESAENQELGENAEQETETLILTINGEIVTVVWEDNESVTALQELVSEEPISIRMSMYGGFEQVGSIGTSLPRDDEQTTTEAGDIVLYSGDQIVVFYGSNSWAYTRLGKVTDKSNAEMTELLGNGDVTIMISME